MNNYLYFSTPTDLQQPPLLTQIPPPLPQHPKWPPTTLTRTPSKPILPNPKIPKTPSLHKLILPNRHPPLPPQRPHISPHPSLHSRHKRISRNTIVCHPIPNYSYQPPPTHVDTTSYNATRRFVWRHWRRSWDIRHWRILRLSEWINTEHWVRQWTSRDNGRG